MKPTLDEEIRERALQLLEDLQHGSHEHDDKLVESAIRAGIEAWERQEPSAAMVAAAITAMETGITGSKHERMRLVYRAMMSASTKEFNDKG